MNTRDTLANLASAFTSLNRAATLLGAALHKLPEEDVQTLMGFKVQASSALPRGVAIAVDAKGKQVVRIVCSDAKAPLIELD